jgi:paraquat-inducible protein B
MTENQPNQKTPTKEMIDDFETTLSEKNKLIAKIQKELEDTARVRAKIETENDNLKLEKQSALDRAERAEARYLRNTELKAKSQAQSQSLLNTLFGGSQ